MFSLSHQYDTVTGTVVVKYDTVTGTVVVKYDTVTGTVVVKYDTVTGTVVVKYVKEKMPMNAAHHGYPLFRRRSWKMSLPSHDEDAGWYETVDF